MFLMSEAPLYPLTPKQNPCTLHPEPKERVVVPYLVAPPSFGWGLSCKVVEFHRKL